MSKRQGQTGSSRDRDRDRDAGDTSADPSRVTSGDAARDPRSDPPREAGESRARPNQLSDADGVFLSFDSPVAPSCIAGLSIVEAEEATDFSFDRFLGVLSERIALVDRFRWKLKEVPFGLDHAYWVEAEDFDPADHVQRIALPAPGDREALAALIGFLHGLPLDRSRPLWECWWIEGLEGGRVAILLKFHHCMMDGESGMGLTQILFDLSSEPQPVAPEPNVPRPAGPRAPGSLEVAIRALRNARRRPEKIAAHARLAAREGFRRFLGGDSAKTAPAVPPAPFNDRLSGQRAFAFASIPLSPLRDARKHFDVKMNDLLMELVASSLRRTLERQAALPDRPIVAVCPVSLRSEDDDAFGNRLSSIYVSLSTDEPDPVERLLAISKSSREAKERLAEGEFEFMSAFGECFVPGALRLAANAAHAFSKQLPIPGNLVFSNVRGLHVPLYIAGARVSEIYPLSMLQVATGMNVTAVTHDDQVDFGFLVDGKLVPDPWCYADALQEAFDEFLEAVDRHLATRDRPHVPRQEPAASSPRGGRPPIEVEPLDLVLLMSGLSHVRAPSRDPIGTPVEED